MTASSGGVRPRQPTAGGAGSMFKFYSGDDSPGIQMYILKPHPLINNLISIPVDQFQY